MLEPINLNTERLTLRPFTEEDIEALRDLANDPLIAATTLAVPHPYRREHASDWIKLHNDWWLSGQAYTFAIELTQSNCLIGAIDLRVNKSHSRAELGYWVGSHFWNQGFATEAARAVVNFGLHGVGLTKVTSSHLLGNPASGKVMRKIGMKQEGLLHSHIFKNGKFHDSVVYGILSTDPIL